MLAKNTETSHARCDKPNQPIAQFVQEADNLYVWCMNDTEELNTVGITKEMIQELPTRSEACREAEAVWKTNYSRTNDAQKHWRQQALEAIQLRKELLQSMRYAFRKEPELLRVLAGISKGNGYADLIQDLNDIASIGKQHLELMDKIAFDTSLLDISATKSDELAELWAIAKVESDNHREFKLKRNIAFWHLNELLTEIRAAGKYVFRNNASRRKGYYSKYWKQKNQRKTNPSHNLSTNNPTLTQGK